MSHYTLPDHRVGEVLPPPRCGKMTLAEDIEYLTRRGEVRLATTMRGNEIKPAVAFEFANRTWADGVVSVDYVDTACWIASGDVGVEVLLAKMRQTIQDLCDGNVTAF